MQTIEQDVVAEASDLRPSWLTQAEWPFPIRSMEADGQNLAVTDTGGSGPALLFVHVGMWSIVWRDVLVELQHDYRCITLDPPGTGLTAGPKKTTMADAADAIDAVVRGLDLDDVTLVFHDLGGAATLDAASRWPERVNGVVAVNTFGWRPSGAGLKGMLALMGSAPMRELDVWTGWMPRLASTRFGLGRHWSRSTRRTFRHAMKHRGRRSLHRYMAAVRRHDFNAVDRAVADLGSLPLLTVFGQRSDQFKFQPKWAERFPNTTHVVVAKGNHFPMCDDPRLVARSIADWHRLSVH